MRINFALNLLHANETNAVGWRISILFRMKITKNYKFNARKQCLVLSGEWGVFNAGLV